MEDCGGLVEEEANKPTEAREIILSAPGTECLTCRTYSAPTAPAIACLPQGPWSLHPVPLLVAEPGPWSCLSASLGLCQYGSLTLGTRPGFSRPPWISCLTLWPPGGMRNRNLSPSSPRPPLAVRCGLFHCSSWGRRSARVFAKLVTDHVFGLETMGRHPVSGLIQVSP